MALSFWIAPDQTRSRWTIAVFSLVWLSVASGTLCAGEVPAAEIPKLIEAVRAAEQRLVSLSVTASSHSEFLEQGQWQTSQRTEVTASLPAWPSRNAKVEIHDKRSWDRARQRWFQESGAVAHDGRTGQRLITALNGRPALRGLITEQRPPLLDRGISTAGWGASLYGVFRNRGIGFSDYLAADPKGFFVRTIHRDQLDGIPVVRIEERIKQQIHRWYLDPERGYALLRAELLFDDGQRLASRTSVTELSKVAEGVFYPRVVVAEVYKRQNGIDTLSSRGTTEVQSATANNLDLDNEATFRITWPHGTNIEDRIMNTRFRASDPDPILSQALDREKGHWAGNGTLWFSNTTMSPFDHHSGC